MYLDLVKLADNRQLFRRRDPGSQTLIILFYNNLITVPLPSMGLLTHMYLQEHESVSISYVRHTHFQRASYVKVTINQSTLV